MKVNKLGRPGAVGLAIVAALLTSALPAAADPGAASAFAATVNVSDPCCTSAVNLGPLVPSNSNGQTSNTMAEFNANGLVTAGLMTTSATRDAATGALNASATVADGAINLGALTGSLGALTASCSATSQGNTGTSTLINSSLAGLNLPMNPSPNTILNITLPSPIPGAPPVSVATLTLNEQSVSPDGSLTVNAFHLKILPGAEVGALVGQGEIVLSSVTCGAAAYPIPLASGIGMWLTLGLIGLAAIPIGRVIIRRRQLHTAK